MAEYCCSMLTAVKQRLAAAKMGSALLIDLGVFALCFGSFLAVMYFAFGFDDITSGSCCRWRSTLRDSTPWAFWGG
ncbi:MAG: hypothetical protein ACLTSG_01110 [Lachnospiraceae bacterium]